MKWIDHGSGIANEHYHFYICLVLKQLHTFAAILLKLRKYLLIIQRLIWQFIIHQEFVFVFNQGGISKLLYLLNSEVAKRPLFIECLPRNAYFWFLQNLGRPCIFGMYSCNNITTILTQISRLFYFGFFSKTNHQMII